jgi:hypothetical protein
MYIEGILDRIDNPELQKEDNPGRIILDGTLGEYLENYDNHIYDLFVTRAKGKYLDLHASLYSIFRHEDETDKSLRQRILTEESIVQSTSDFLALDVVLWVYFTDILGKDVLSSRNPYLRGEHEGNYVFMATGSDTDYIKGKFLLEDIKWV